MKKCNPDNFPTSFLYLDYVTPLHYSATHHGSDRNFVTSWDMRREEFHCTIRVKNNNSSYKYIFTQIKNKNKVS